MYSAIACFTKFENFSSSRDDFEATLPSKLSTDMNKALTRSNLLFNWHGGSRIGVNGLHVVREAEKIQRLTLLIFLVNPS